MSSNMPKPEDFIGRRYNTASHKATYVAAHKDAYANPNRDPDLAPEGGNKNLTLPKITPYIASVISNANGEEFRISVEQQFRELENVTRALQIIMEKIAQQVPPTIEAHIKHLEDENILLKERVKRLEEA